MSTPAAVASSQNVTIPAISELYDANFLDHLLPHTKADIVLAGPSSGTSQSTNPLMEALKSTVHRTYTTNDARAYDSTSSATLDAFHMLRPFTPGSDIYECLGKSWEEDPQMTLRIIWNLRSIRDGKGEKEAFYQYVIFSRIVYVKLLTYFYFSEHGDGCTKITLALRWKTCLS